MVFYPKRYYQGLTRKQKKERGREIQRFKRMSWKNPKAYVGFHTDTYVKSKPSNYTLAWRKRFPNAKSLKEKARATGVPYPIIKKSYDRGMAAWRTGHRPGATEQQWGYARVHSFLLCGKTYHTTDSDLVKIAKKDKMHGEKSRRWWKSCKN